MAASSDSSLTFFKKATPEQWSYVLSLYHEVLKLKAGLRTKKGGPEELIQLDTWYQEQLPKLIHSRKQPYITREELVKITKWKLMRGKFRPHLIELAKLNSDAAVTKVSKKAFKRIPKLPNAITALTNLKGVGPPSASAVLAAGYPEIAPYMADECMLSTPGVESTDYTLAEYLNYAEQVKTCCERLNKSDSESKWNPHKLELALWTHFLAQELKPSLLENLPVPENVTPNGKYEEHSNDSNDTKDHSSEEANAEEDDEAEHPLDKKDLSGNNSKKRSESSFGADASGSDDPEFHSNNGASEENSNIDEPPAKKACV